MRTSSLFLQLHVGTRRKHSTVPVGVNKLLWEADNVALPVRDKDGKFHNHDNDVEAWDQCDYELRDCESITKHHFTRIPVV